MITQFRQRSIAVVAALALSAVALTPALTRAASSPLTVPVVGAVLGGGTFTGALTLTSFAVRDGQILALGTLSGILTNAAGVATTVISNVTLPVSVASATCDILHLDIGPISLNLLGLQVDLSRIVLDITAQSGAGNLLGNLLCAVAGLLDNPGALLARVLNQILGVLAGL